MAVPVKELWQMAVTGQDDEATRIACRVSINWQIAPPEGLDITKFYTAARCKAVEDRIREKSVPPSMTQHFEGASYLQGLQNQTPHMQLHGNLHHWNIVRGDDGKWQAINPHNIFGPPYMDLAATITNPYDPALNMDPEFVLNRERMERQISVASEAISWDKGVLASGVFVHAVQAAARRIHGTPPGQVGLPYWEKAATLAAGIAGIRLDKGFIAFSKS